MYSVEYLVTREDTKKISLTAATCMNKKTLFKTLFLLQDSYRVGQLLHGRFSHIEKTDSSSVHNKQLLSPSCCSTQNTVGYTVSDGMYAKDIQRDHSPTLVIRRQLTITRPVSRVYDRC